MQTYRLLHDRNLTRIPVFGAVFIRVMQRRMTEVIEAKVSSAPSISILIRSRNNREQLAVLLDDIEAQAYEGKLELIVVDTESDDGTVELAKARCAKVINIKQKDFSYPKSLNLGFMAAQHDWVFCLVDHSALTNTATLKVASRWHSQKKVAAVYRINLPNGNATRSERLTYGIFQLPKLRRRAYLTTKKDVRGGFMAANNSLIRRDAWKAVGGFDEAYGAGGEDFAFGVSLREAGYGVVFDPALSVYHTHGLHTFQQLQQVRYWYSLSNPLSFDAKKLQRYRSDLRQRD